MTAATMTVKVTLDDLPGIKAVVETSIAYYGCLCEFEDDPSCCSEHEQAWMTAVGSFKKAGDA